MELYNNDELIRINNAKETNQKLEEFFSNKREEWTKQITPLFEDIKGAFNAEKSQIIIDIQANALTFRQMINEEISFFLNKRSREEVKIKKLRQEKFVFYAVGVGLKTGTAEKSLLIDAHIAENERNIQLIENYIEFIRASSKNLESLGYTVKNIIELMNYLK